MKRRALRFPDSADFGAALGVLDGLAAEGPLEYDLISEPEGRASIIVLPEWSYQQFLPLLTKQGLAFSELPVRPMSELAPREQAKLRGLVMSRNGAQVDATP